jgi:ATP-dependent Lon protease
MSVAHYPPPFDLPLLPLRCGCLHGRSLFVRPTQKHKALRGRYGSGAPNHAGGAEKTAAKDEPSVQDMFEVGCRNDSAVVLKLPTDGTVKVLVGDGGETTVNRIVKAKVTSPQASRRLEVTALH